MVVDQSSELVQQVTDILTEEPAEDLATESARLHQAYELINEALQ